LDDNDQIATTGQTLTPTRAVIDATGGWCDAGDYMKLVETTSYTVALPEIGVRDFPNQVGANAPRNHSSTSRPPDSISYEGHAYGIQFLMKMWAATLPLYYEYAVLQYSE
jgi:hypothetical protein